MRICRDNPNKYAPYTTKALETWIVIRVSDWQRTPKAVTILCRETRVVPVTAQEPLRQDDQGVLTFQFVAQCQRHNQTSWTAPLGTVEGEWGPPLSYLANESEIHMRSNRWRWRTFRPLFSRYIHVSLAVVHVGNRQCPCCPTVFRPGGPCLPVGSCGNLANVWCILARFVEGTYH